MPSRSGELAMRPLPAVLLDLHEEFATGRLVLKRGRVSKTVDLVNGNPVSTASTPRDETLGHFLVTTGVISEEQHRHAVARASTIGGKLGEALVAQQVLSVEQLIEQLGNQARHKLIQALRWPQGAWRFDPTDAVEGIQLRMVDVVLAGLRETAVDDLASLARLEGMRFVLTARGSRLRHELRRLHGEQAIVLLAEGSTIEDLERAFEDRAKARLAVDAMLLCDAIETVAPDVGLGSEAVTGASNLGRAPTRPPAASSALFDIMFEDLGEDDPDGGIPIELVDPELLGLDSGVVSQAAPTATRPDGEHAAGVRQDPETEPRRAGWREALEDPRSGAALVRSIEAGGHVEAAFLAASTMVALGTADPEMTAVYEARRLRGVTTPDQPLGRDPWALLRHPEDRAELGALMELVAPAVHRVAPMSLAEGELDPGQRLVDADLPASFLRLHRRYAALLGVEPPAVYPRAELGAQIHVLACDPPVLVAGAAALAAPERPELVFRLVRAMTFLWPGRAVGASRPGRVLRAVVMAVFREASGAEGAPADALAEQAAEAVARLLPQARVQARGAALRLLSRAGGLNLSLWARSLSRTADRAGLLLCGDVPAAFAGAREAGELDRDLVEFAFSAAHVQLRNQLGLGRG